MTAPSFTHPSQGAIPQHDGIKYLKTMDGNCAFITPQVSTTV